MQRLKKFYIENVIPVLLDKFHYENVNQVPRIKKIVVNRGFDESCQNSKILDLLLSEFTLIAGQKAILTRSKKAISNFKLRENMPVGMTVTLRGKNMYSFLDRLINLALPRIRDFHGLSSKSFDNLGNYSIGLSEQFMFPEVDFDKSPKIKGMDINIVVEAKNKQESYFLLKELGMPFKS